MKSLCFALAIVAAAAPHDLIAQEEVTVAVRGVVLDTDTGERVTDVALAIDDGEALMAAAGNFEMSVAPGAHVLTVNAAGYIETFVEIDVTANEPLELEIRLRRLFLNEEISVTADAESLRRPSAVGVQPRDVFDVAGGLDNVFRALQLLPGVAAPEDFGGRLSVRGGGPDQNLTVMDGVEIHNPYRIFGLISAFNPETVDRFELTAGGFSAAYGDRLSSLLIVDNRAGRPAFGGSGSLSVTDANFLVEGALPGDGNSYLLTARRTYYDLVAGRFSDNDFPSFRDFQGRFDLGVGPGVLTIEGITSREGADVSFEDEEEGDMADAGADASNDLVALRYRTLMGSGISSLTTLSWYRNSDFLDFNGSLRNEGRRANVPGDDAFAFSDVIFAREVLVEDFAARQQFTAAVGTNHFLDFGFELHDVTSATRFRTEGDRNEQEANGSSIQGGVGLPDELDSTLEGTRGAVWLEDTINLGSRFTVVPGLRYSWSTANGDAGLSPRLALYWQAGPRTRLKLAGGQFRQSPGYEKLQSADYFIDLSDARARDIESQRATHAILGVERTLGNGFMLSLEGYYKRFSDLIVGRLETEAERRLRIARYDFPDELQDSVPSTPIITSNPSNGGAGEAYGVDLFLMRRPTGPRGLYGWLAYTLGKAEQEAYGRRFAFDYDRRHSLNVVANYRFSRRWEVATTGQWASGFPRTAPIGVRVAATEDPDHDPGSPLPPRLIPQVDADGNPVYSISYGDTNDLNNSKLPHYARLDLRLSYRPQGPAGRWEFYLEVLNVLGRDNATRMEPVLVFNPNGPEPTIVETPENALPRIPSFGVRFRF